MDESREIKIARILGLQYEKKFADDGLSGFLESISGASFSEKKNTIQIRAKPMIKKKGEKGK